MRAVLKKDHEKGGNIPSYEVLTVFTNGGVWKADEMYFHDYDEDTEYLCWEERRVDFAKSAMPFFQQVFKDNYQFIAECAVKQADALIAELKKKE